MCKICIVVHRIHIQLLINFQKMIFPFPWKFPWYFCTSFFIQVGMQMYENECQNISTIFSQFGENSLICNNLNFREAFSQSSSVRFTGHMTCYKNRHKMATNKQISIQIKVKINICLSFQNLLLK